MAKTARKKSTSKKSAAPGVSYKIHSVESYIEDAVTRVRNEIMPHRAVLDQRDKDQYESSRKLLFDTNALIGMRQKHIEDSVMMVRDDIREIHNSQKETSQAVTSAVDELKNSLGRHINDETGELIHLRTEISTAVAQVKAVQDTLDNVSANGNKGLSASLTDVYDKVKNLEEITAGSKARAKLWHVLHDAIDTSMFLRPLRTKWGSIIYLLITMILLNTITHSLGLDLNLMNMFKWVIKIFSLGNGG